MQAKILIVDDEETIRYTLERTLQQNYDVQTADSGATALDLARQTDFDLALIDIKLADISGIELLARLKEHAPDTIVIVLTGYASIETSVESLRHGAHDYLFKPCKPADLRESVRTGLIERQKRLQQRQLMTQLSQLASSINSLTDVSGAVAPQIPNLSLEQADIPAAPDRFIRCGSLVIDTLRRIVTVNNQQLEVSATEFDVLFYLVNKSPQTVSPMELIQQVQGYESELWEAKHIARQYVYRLRQKIKDVIGHDTIIRTIRGQGYTINA